MIVRSSSYLDVFVSLIIVFFSFLFAFYIYKSKKYRDYAIQLLVGYFLRVFLLFYAVYTDNPLRLPIIGLSKDSLGFYKSAVIFSEGGVIRYGGFFAKFLGIVFAITGCSQLIGRFLVLLFSVGTIFVLITIINEFIKSSSYKQLCVYLICLLPNYMLLSVALLRETIISFFFALSILYFIRWFTKSRGEIAFLQSILFAFVASMFHGAVGLVVVIYIMFRFIYNPQKQNFVLYYKNIIYAFLFLVVFVAGYKFFGTYIFKKVIDKLEYDDDDDDPITRNYRGGSSYGQYVGDARTPARVIKYAIPRFVYFMFSPLPWQWRNVVDVLSFISSSFVYMCIFISTIKFILKAHFGDKRRNLLLVLFVATMIMASIFSWGCTNTGTALRHRDKFIVLYMVMLALCAKMKEQPKQLQAANRLDSVR